MKNKRNCIYFILIFLLIIILIGITIAFKNGKNNAGNPSLPQNYTLDSFKIEKILEISCKKDGECKTPSEYLIQSRCPFMSKCLHDKCTVVCPDFRETN